LGSAHRAEGDLEAAISYYRRAVDLDPGSERARTALREALDAREPAPSLPGPR